MADDRGASPASFARKLLGQGPVSETIELETLDTPGVEDDAAVAALIPAAVPQGFSRDEVASVARRIVRVEPLDPRGDFITEAIIIPEQRPAIDVVGDGFTITHPLWTGLNAEPVRGHIVDAILSAGRIELSGHPSLPYGGTGFVVGPNLLMTNRHVAQIFAEGLGVWNLRFTPGLGAGIDFKRERGNDAGDPIAVRDVRMIHPYWDMALLEVEGLEGRKPLTLAAAPPGGGEPPRVAVIGYPAFDPRNDAAVQDSVFGGVYNVKRLQPGYLKAPREVASFGKTVMAATHDSSTLGGNSGSVVLDCDSGLVVGLHFAGIYRDSNFAVPAEALAADGRVIDAGVTIDGGGRRADGPWTEWWSRAEPREQVGGSAPPAPPPSQTATWTVPIRIDITVDPARRTGSASAVPAQGEMIERMVEPRHDGEEVPRSGYDENFIGLAVPLPRPRRPQELAALADGGHVVRYHHFSLVMHAARRLALFTAANVDASPAAKKPEPGRDYTRDALGGLAENDREKWFADPRLRGVEQLPDRFFNKDRQAFDKGHLVRREDVAWGSSYSEVQAANGDTYFTTNCSPQTAGFNRSNHRDNWGALEDLVLRQARSERYCLFSGPVLQGDDPGFAGLDDQGGVSVRIPQRYWKVVVANDAGRLKLFTFILKQDLSQTPLEFTVPDEWKPHQIALSTLEVELGSLDFDPALHAADQFGL